MKAPGTTTFYNKPKRVALFNNGKIVKVFPSLNDTSKHFNVEISVLSRIFNHKKYFSFLKKNQDLKIISENQFIKHEIILFKRHINYLKKKNKLFFNCNSCLRLTNRALPYVNEVRTSEF
jgi:hypothetical protein